MEAASDAVAGPRPTFRRATPADVPGIVGLYSCLSSESLHMRFSCAMSSTALAAAAALGPDGRTVALLAVVGERIVAEGRYLPLADGGYEFGITVADDWQHRGLGRRLLDLLREDAGDRGIPVLRAMVRPDNHPMLALLREVGCAVVAPVDEWEVVVEVSCDEGMPGWPDPRTGRRILVESGALWDDPATAAMRAAGFEIRQCLGPRRGPVQTCPLLRLGRCRLAEDADVLACLLPHRDANGRAVAEAHKARRRERLVATSVEEWREAVPRLISA